MNKLELTSKHKTSISGSTEFYYNHAVSKIYGTLLECLVMVRQDDFEFSLTTHTEFVNVRDISLPTFKMEMFVNGD